MFSDTAAHLSSLKIQSNITLFPTTFILFFNFCFNILYNDICAGQCVAIIFTFVFGRFY